MRIGLSCLLALVAACSGTVPWGTDAATSEDPSLREDASLTPDAGDPDARPDAAPGADAAQVEDTCVTWDPPWIGGDCAYDLDCAYDTGFCLVTEQGFPCGMCSQACSLYCPDLDGAPVTFCVDTSLLGMEPGEGLCVSRCDPDLFGGVGCREGYACVTAERFGDPETTQDVCIPETF